MPGGDGTHADVGDGKQPPTKRRQDEGNRLFGMSQVITAATAVERVTSLCILGVIMNDKLTAADHVIMVLSSCIAAFSTRCLYCAREARRPRPCMTSSTPSSSRGLSMQRRRGLGCAQLLIMHVLTHCCVAASGSATVTMISRP